MNPLIVPASLFIRAGSRVKNFLYDREILKPQRPPLPVISVGNISFGGTGKTPLAMELLAWIRKQGFRPALVTRGYRGAWEKSGGVLSDGRSLLGTWKEAGDEPYLAALANPEAGVFIGRNRIASCRTAGEMGFNIAVLDDGFQHRRLGRSIDIVLFDPGDLTALRETRASLDRSDILLIKDKSRFPDNIKKILNPRHCVFEYRVTPRGYRKADAEGELPPDAMRGKKVLAFCGIAGPERFFRLLEELGAELVRQMPFPDHYSFPARALKKIEGKFLESGAAAAVTTEKDAVKLAAGPWPHDRMPLYVLRIGVDVEAGFYSILREFLVAHRGKGQSS